MGIIMALDAVYFKVVGPSILIHCFVTSIVCGGGSLVLVYRGSYMSAHVLLNLLNELGKRDKMRGLPSI